MRIDWFWMSCWLMLTVQWVQAGSPVKVACVGNSITYGTGLADRERDAYPVQLQRMLGDGYVVGNFGKPGATLLRHGHRPYVQQTEYREALAFGADIAVIHLGTNDTDPRNWPNYRDEFVSDYLALIDSLKATNPSMRILVARLAPIADRHPRFSSGTKCWHTDIQSAIETVARVAQADLIDFEAPLYPYPFLLPDAIHPNPEGAGLLARTVYQAITGNYGGLQLPLLYTDGMVLQRDVPLTLRGKADSGTRVTVCIAGQRCEATADVQGQWQVQLAPLKAGTDYQLLIQTDRKEKRLFKQVAVGEVWLCSGQSNMQFMLKQAATATEDLAHAEDPALRFFDMKARWETQEIRWSPSAIDSVNHLHYFKPTRWESATAATAADFSAIAYHFGKMLRDSLQVPVGLICNAVGGSTTESWIDRNRLENDFPAILRDWTHNDFIQQWARQRARYNLKAGDSIATQFGLTKPAYRHPSEPCYLFESGIAPLQRYPIQGVIWYQGESNAHNVEAHETLFKLLTTSWRRYWQNEALPFYYVQLSSLNRPSWTWFRDSQRRLMQTIPHTGMAVSSDLGDSLDVHPPFKREIGQRLARWALQDTYHHVLVPSGPLCQKAVYESGRVHLYFTYAHGLQTARAEEPITFEVAEEEGLFYPAKATIDGETIWLESSEVRRPRYVRYGWQPFTRANLQNSAQLPASTFRMAVE